MTPTLLLLAALQAAPTVPESAPAPVRRIPLQISERLRDPNHLMSGHERGAVWLRGATFKAAADGRGFRYVPFLGSTASRNWPVTFRVERVLVGGEPVGLEGPRAELDGFEVTVERGALEVRYRAVPGGVEQTYRLDGLGADVAGDVVVEVALATDLEPVVDGPGLRFDGPEGGVRLGGAVALDGAGRRLALAPELDGDLLRYRIPAGFAARAGDALVIDPLVETFGAVAFAADTYDPDVAYEATADTYNVVSTMDFSAADRDIHYFTIGVEPTTVHDTGFVELVSGDAYRPRSATLPGADRFIVAYMFQEPSGARWIYSRSRASAPGSSWQVTHPVVGTSSSAGPIVHDVGGELFDGPNPFGLVVWEQWSATGGPSAIVAQRLEADASIIGPQIVLAAPDPSAAHRAPAVSKYAGDPGSHSAWWVAWSSGPPGGIANEVRTARVLWSGTITELASSLFTLTGLSGSIGALDVSAPYDTDHSSEALHVVASATQGGVGRTFLATRERGQAPWSAPATPLSEVDIHDSHGTGGAGIANSGARAVVAYSDRLASGSAPVLRASVLQREKGGGAAVGERRFEIEPVDAGAFDQPRMVSDAAGGGPIDSERVLVVWTDATVPGRRDVHAALLRMSAPGVIGRNFCAGHRNSAGELGFLSAFGTNDTLTPKDLRATGLPPQQFGLFVASESFGSVVPVGGQGRLCLAGSIGRFNGSIASSGANGELSFLMNPAAIPQGTGTVAAVAGATWGFQAWHRDANPGQTSNFSSGVQITF